MTPLQIILSLLAALFVLLTARMALPKIALASFPGKVRSRFLEPAQTQASLSRSPALQEQVKKLSELGFETLGIKVEAPPFSRNRYFEFNLASTDLQTFASIVLHPSGKPLGTYLFTPFEDGGMIFTRSYPAYPEIEAPGVSIHSVLGGNFDTMLANHLNRVEQNKLQGRQPYPSFDQPARLRATHAFYVSPFTINRFKLLFSYEALLFSLALLLLALAIWSILFSL